MNKTRIVLNTLLKQKEHNDGQSQLTLVKSLLKTGVKNIELRREYSDDTVAELAALSELRSANRLTYFYSVPDDLFVKQQLNPKILQYFSEASILGVHYVKMTLGDFDSKAPSQVETLLSLLPQDIDLNIENDQTAGNSDVNKLVSFFEQFKGCARKVGFVNDLGNWIFTNQSAADVAPRLLPYTRYVHLKNYRLNTDKQPMTVPFDQGDLDWRTLITLFDESLPVALEFPATNEDLELDLRKLTKD